MITKRESAIVVLAFCVAFALLMTIPVRSRTGECNPWLDSGRVTTIGESMPTARFMQASESVKHTSRLEYVGKPEKTSLLASSEKETCDIDRMAPKSKYDTSEYLMGEIVYSVIFPDSNGVIDANLENWDQSRMDFVASKISGALQWWADQYPYSYGRISFTSPLPQRILVDYEPISRPHTDQALWIGQAMTKLGVVSTGLFGPVWDYVSELRASYATDWGFVVFVVDSKNDADGKFADGDFAYAYPGGPFMVVTYDNDGWGISDMDRVVAHEFGHIFYAENEYDSFTYNSGYLNEAEITYSGCMMDDSTWCLSSGTKLQVGWRDSDIDGIPDIIDTVPTSSFDVSSKAGNIGDVEYQGTAYDVAYENKNPYGMGNNISINEVTVRYRLDGGTWNTANLYDGNKFRLSVSITTAGTHTVEAYAVNSVNNQQSPHIYASYTVLSAEIDQISTGATRVDLGSSVQVGYHLKWSHNSSSLKTGTVYTNCGNGAIGSDGWAYVSFFSNSVETRTVQVINVEVNGVTIGHSQNGSNPSIIWDRLAFDLISTNDTRVDPNSYVILQYGIRYEYDGERFDDTKGTVAGFAYDRQNELWEKTILTSDIVGIRSYDEGYLTITDSKYHLTARQDVQGICIITDSLVFYASANASRVGVDRSFILSYIVKYAYDNSTLKDDFGSLFGFTWDSEGQRWCKLVSALGQVGIVTYDETYASIVDSEYGLTSKQLGNSVSVISDEVEITLSAPQRIMTGENATITWIGHYRFDNAIFNGTVILNNTITGLADIGRIDYTTMEIIDYDYAVNVFNSNAISIIFDKIDVTHTTSLQFATIGATIDLSYAYDHSPVTDASMTVNDVPATYVGNGEYVFSQASLTPIATYSILIDRAGFSTVTLAFSEYAIGNILVMCLIIGTIITAMLLFYKRHRNRRKLDGQGIRNRINALCIDL